MNLYPLQPGALYVLDQGWAIFRMVQFKPNLKMYTKMYTKRSGLLQIKIGFLITLALIVLDIGSV